MIIWREKEGLWEHFDALLQAMALALPLLGRSASSERHLVQRGLALTHSMQEGDRVAWKAKSREALAALSPVPLERHMVLAQYDPKIKQCLFFLLHCDEWGDANHARKLIWGDGSITLNPLQLRTARRSVLTILLSLCVLLLGALLWLSHAQDRLRQSLSEQLQQEQALTLQAIAERERNTRSAALRAASQLDQPYVLMSEGIVVLGALGEATPEGHYWTSFRLQERAGEIVMIRREAVSPTPLPDPGSGYVWRVERGGGSDDNPNRFAVRFALTAP
jgi:hypothetical protein